MGKSRKPSYYCGPPLLGVTHNRNKLSVSSLAGRKSSTGSMFPRLSTTSTSSRRPSNVASSGVSSSFMNQCLDAHNSYRKKHGAGSMTISNSLSKYAQEWADKLAAMDTMQHRTDNTYGENIFMKWSSDKSFDISGKEPVSDWYSEIKLHNFKSEGSGVSQSGHFTQVIWKDSKKLGIGKSRSKSNKILVVCNYDPPGNFVGEYKKNVRP